MLFLVPISTYLRLSKEYKKYCKGHQQQDTNVGHTLLGAEIALASHTAFGVWNNNKKKSQWRKILSSEESVGFPKILQQGSSCFAGSRQLKHLWPRTNFAETNEAPRNSATSFVSLQHPPSLGFVFLPCKKELLKLLNYVRVFQLRSGTAGAGTHFCSFKAGRCHWKKLFWIGI